ncbi:MAG: hypothetical protein FD180_260 [Planctomycetota bacterium]|nr:MAG: hypothetical protein FD180_260 [Planctomycetota bacterium]
MNPDRETSTADASSLPRAPWGVWIAFAMFLVALALPACDVYGEAWSGFRCARYIAEAFLKVLLLRNPGWVDPITAALTVPNVVMLLAPGLPMLPFRKRRLWPAIVATACVGQILHFRLLVGFDRPSGLRFGFVVWFAAFATLAASLWLWETRVRRAEQSAPQNG